jgi:hypothetical protein
MILAVISAVPSADFSLNDFFDLHVPHRSPAVLRFIESLAAGPALLPLNEKALKYYCLLIRTRG